MPHSALATGLSSDQADYLVSWQKKWPLDSFQARLTREQIEISLVEDENYPKLLKFIPDWTPVLFYRGNLDILSQNCLSVVGARAVTRYGREVIKEILDEQLVGLTIVSGLMFGVDELAHERALELGLPTAAFLGYGLEHVWPKTVESLKERIIEQGGVVVSEFAPWQGALSRNFPIRNRLVAGASVGTLVVEAAKRSGSLITAHLALDYGREVMAVPGSIFNTKSEGCLDLIKKGATPVTNAGEIVQTLAAAGVDINTSNMHIKQEKSKKNDLHFSDEWQARVYELIAQEPQESEKLAEKLGEADQVAGACTTLELMGLIGRNSAGWWEVK